MNSPIMTISSGGLMIVGNSTVTLTGALTNSTGGELQLISPTTTTVQAASIQNSGLIDGSGHINATVANLSGGQLSIGLGQIMTITGSGNTNASGGLINLSGGTLHDTQTLTNASGGIIAGFGALRVDGGLTNNGTLQLAGASSVFAAVTNSGTGTIHLSGNQPNVFFNSVANAGLLTVDGGASGTFYGVYYRRRTHHEQRFALRQRQLHRRHHQRHRQPHSRHRCLAGQFDAQGRQRRQQTRRADPSTPPPSLT